MRILLVFLIVFTIHKAAAQDTAVKYKIDEHLTVTFPGLPDSHRMNGAMFRTVRDSSAVYMVMLYDTTKFEPLTKKEFERVLKSFVEGASEAGRNFSHKSLADTIIGGATGKLLFFSKPLDTELGVQKMWFFVTLRNGHCYAVQASQQINGTETTNKIHAFLNSARFSPDPEFLSEEDAKGYRIGYLIGKIIAPILLLGVVLAAISYANRRKQRV